jgi:hypothetical protein
MNGLKAPQEKSDNIIEAIITSQVVYNLLRSVITNQVKKKSDLFLGINL